MSGMFFSAADATAPGNSTSLLFLDNRKAPNYYYSHLMRMSLGTLLFYQAKNDYFLMDDCSAATSWQASVVDSNQALILFLIRLPLGTLGASNGHPVDNLVEVP